MVLTTPPVFETDALDVLPLLALFWIPLAEPLDGKAAPLFLDAFLAIYGGFYSS